MAQNAPQIVILTQQYPWSVVLDLQYDFMLNHQYNSNRYKTAGLSSTQKNLL